MKPGKGRKVAERTIRWDLLREGDASFQYSADRPAEPRILSRRTGPASKNTLHPVVSGARLSRRLLDPLAVTAQTEVQR
jgi:hypothetical protein